MSSDADAFSISAPKSSGPLMPPAAVPIAQQNAIAIARVSIGKTSRAVRYAALPPACITTAIDADTRS